MDSSQNAATPGVSAEKTPLDAPLGDFLDDKATAIHEDGSRSGSYAAQLERILPAWIDWMNDHGVAHLEDVDERNLSRWTKYLSRRVKASDGDSDGGITRATAWTYFNAVRAYLGWCETWRDLDANPADGPKPSDAMPDRPSRSSADQQFWSPEQRQTLLQHLDERAHEAIDEDCKETRLQGLKDQLALSDDSDAEELRQEVDDLEQRIEELTEFTPGTEVGSRS